MTNTQNDSAELFLNPRPFLIWAGSVLFLWVISSFILAWVYVDWKTEQAISEAQKTQQQVISGGQGGIRRIYDMTISLMSVVARYPKIQSVLANHPTFTRLTPEKMSVTISASELETHPDLESISEIFSDLIKITNHLNEIWIVNKHGVVLISGTSWANRVALGGTMIGNNHAEQAYFLSAIHGENNMNFQSASEEIPGGLITSVPIYDEKSKEIIGVFAARMSVNFLNPWLNQGFIFWSDKNGVVFRASDPKYEMMSIPGALVDQLSEQERAFLYKRPQISKVPLTSFSEDCAAEDFWFSGVFSYFCRFGINDSLENDLLRLGDHPRLYLSTTEGVQVGDFAVTVSVAVDYIGARLRYVLSIFLVSSFVSFLLIGLITSLIYYSRLVHLVRQTKLPKND